MKGLKLSVSSYRNIYILTARGHIALDLNGRRPFQTGPRWPGLRSPPWSQQILKFEFDDHFIFYNLMFDSQFHLELQRSGNYCP